MRGCAGSDLHVCIYMYVLDSLHSVHSSLKFFQLSHLVDYPFEALSFNNVEINKSCQFFSNTIYWEISRR